MSKVKKIAGYGILILIFGSLLTAYIIQFGWTDTLIIFAGVIVLSFIVGVAVWWITD